MSIFRSTRRQRRIVAESTATRFPSPAPWPVVHADNCRCTYCH